ncbi:MAG TPA: lysine 5,6-aminomutase subunit alpha [Oligoflexia bacterium]|nr:lysine 5,6-aminomutase subunit alpha [Oligoflexia bacterium]
MAHLELNQQTIIECRKLANQIVAKVKTVIDVHTSVSIERAALRLIGVEGAIQKNGLNYPLVNEIVDQLRSDRVIAKGALYWFANGLLASGLETNELALKVGAGEIKLSQLDRASLTDIRKKAQELCKAALNRLKTKREERADLRKSQGDPFDTTWNGTPLKYVIVATGNIFEDAVQAKAAVEAGADAIAVIRSTAQSLLDYMPEGATTEGFGGTYATQENFKIIRKALDEAGEKAGRYIRLTNYSSGLCMSEIAAAAAIERLDFLLNDAMYGILFRDINMKRTLIDQNFSRMIIAYSDITIHTGEDNYLTTADAVENGHQVLASQFINERFALHAHMREDQMGLGHAAEMDPWHPNVLLLEIARAQMTRDIFPKSPIKFMPPTRHKVGDIFFSHLMDAMFNFVGVLTNQGIQLLGMPTEAMHTPLLQDRWMSIKNANYIFGAAKDLGKEITFKRDGTISKWANKVLDDTLVLLRKIDRDGLFKAIEDRAFANVSRSETGGKGLDGVVQKDKEYTNPFFELL